MRTRVRRQGPAVLRGAPPRTTSATAQETCGEAGSANRRTRSCLTSFERVSGEVNAGCLSCWFFDGLPHVWYLVFPGVREQIVQCLFTVIRLRQTQLPRRQSVHILSTSVPILARVEFLRSTGFRPPDRLPVTAGLGCMKQHIVIYTPAKTGAGLVYLGPPRS